MTRDAVTIDGRGLLRAAEAARYFGIASSTFRTRVGLGRYPPPAINDPGCVQWAAEDLVAARAREMGRSGSCSGSWPRIARRA